MAGVAADDDLDVGVVVDLAFQSVLGQVAVDLSDDQDQSLDGADAGEGPQAPGEDAAAGEGRKTLLCSAPNRDPLPGGQDDAGRLGLINAIRIADD